MTEMQDRAVSTQEQTGEASQRFADGFRLERMGQASDELQSFEAIPEERPARDARWPVTDPGGVGLPAFPAG